MVTLVFEDKYKEDAIKRTQAPRADIYHTQIFPHIFYNKLLDHYLCLCLKLAGKLTMFDIFETHLLLF